MISALLALVAIVAWGCWLAPSQRVTLSGQQVRAFYVALANLGLSGVVALVAQAPLAVGDEFWLPFAGGLVWAVGAWCAFVATKTIGMARAVGTWAPLNIITSLLAGRIFFGEFAHPTGRQLSWLAVALGAILAGVLLIIFAKESNSRTTTRTVSRAGWFAAVGAGVLWGIYYLPVKGSGVNTWSGTLPLAAGMAVGSLFLLLLARESPRLAQRADYARIIATGILWSVGNYSMLLLVERVGAGKGFTFAQLSIVVNAIIGVYWLREPPPRSRAAMFTLAGCALATIGGAVLGNVN